MRIPTTFVAAASRRSALRGLRTLILAASFVSAPLDALASEPGLLPAPPDETVAAPPESADAKHLPRTVLGFVKDAAVSPGLWVELGELFWQHYNWTYLTSVTLAYGWRDWEFGGNIGVYSSGDFQNLNLWAKYAGWKLGPAEVGAGLRTEIPTSHGEWVDVEPFATARLPLGLWDLRSSLGYEITHDFSYNAACLRPIGEHVDVRAELDGDFDTDFDWRVRLLPGVDVHFVHDRWRFTARFSGGAQVHPDTDPFIALSFVLSEA